LGRLLSSQHDHHQEANLVQEFINQGMEKYDIESGEQSLADPNDQLQNLQTLHASEGLIFQDSRDVAQGDEDSVDNMPFPTDTFVPDDVFYQQMKVQALARLAERGEVVQWDAAVGSAPRRTRKQKNDDDDDDDDESFDLESGESEVEPQLLGERVEPLVGGQVIDEQAMFNVSMEIEARLSKRRARDEGEYDVESGEFTDSRFETARMQEDASGPKLQAKETRMQYGFQGAVNDDEDMDDDSLEKEQKEDNKGRWALIGGISVGIAGAGAFIMKMLAAESVDDPNAINQPNTLHQPSPDFTQAGTQAAQESTQAASQLASQSAAQTNAVVSVMT
jgi:hypothetical protein